MIPSADIIAIACIAAAKETDADPTEIASGVLATSGRHSGKIQVSRARAYAALALRAVLEDVATPTIAKLVGAGSPSCYCSSIDFQVKNKMIKWWDDAAFMRVVAAIEKHLALESA